MLLTLSKPINEIRPNAYGKLNYKGQTDFESSDRDVKGITTNTHVA